MFRTVMAALAVCVSLAWAQTEDRTLTFEVASVKPAAPQGPDRVMMGMRGGPGTADPGQATFSGLPLSRIIMTAYDVKSYQVSGPSWLDTERFDIVAKVPKGASKKDFQVMLQNLLAERFKLVVHKEHKDAPIYALVTGKGGPKMKESAPLDTTASKDAQTPPDGRGPTPPAMGRDGMPRMAPGGRGMMMMMGPNGLRMQGARATTAELADILSNQLGRPVIDATGLTAQYDYTLDFSPEGLAMMRGMPMPMGHPTPGAAPESGRESGPSIFTAVQEQLGLKLESRKGPVDLIVVDRVEKTPTEQ